MKKTNGITPRARAWALACDLIPPVPGQADSIWNQGAREIVTGLLLHVQKTHPSLTLKQVARAAAALLAGDYHQIFEAATSENPEAAELLAGGPDNKAVRCLLMQVGAALSPASLADL